MNLQELIVQSLELLLIGMGTVFIILIMLIFLINVVSKLLPEETIEETVHTARAANMTAAPTTDNKDLIAVISAAVSTYRKRHTSQ
jgi:oxaloacetate decarboxylase gamma subunit